MGAEGGGCGGEVWWVGGSLSGVEHSGGFQGGADEWVEQSEEGCRGGKHAKSILEADREALGVIEVKDVVTDLSQYGDPQE